jgi:hypothetical protein
VCQEGKEGLLGNLVEKQKGRLFWIAYTAFAFGLKPV